MLPIVRIQRGPAPSSCSLHDSSASFGHHHGLRAYEAEADHANAKGAIGMKCSIHGCPGDYEERQIAHTVRRDGQVVVVDHVPAEVCSFCGDVLMRPDTIRRVEELLSRKDEPASSAPLYEYA